MPPAIHNPSTWGEFGLLGLIVGALFVMLRMCMTTINKKDERHSETVKAMNESHTQQIEKMAAAERAEREGMTDRWVSSSDKLSQAIDGLAAELRRERH